jgi:hypothetical protein
MRKATLFGVSVVGLFSVGVDAARAQSYDDSPQYGCGTYPFEGKDAQIVERKSRWLACDHSFLWRRPTGAKPSV